MTSVASPSRMRTVVSGSWDPNQVVIADMAGYPVWQGDETPFQARCDSAMPKIPGSARAVSPVGGGDADTDGGWAIYQYGYEVNTGEESDGSTSQADIALSHCSIQIGSAANSSAFASSWPASAQPRPGLSCTFGGS